MVWAAAGNLPEQNKNNKCVNRPPETAVKKYTGTYDLPCTLKTSLTECLEMCLVDAIVLRDNPASRSSMISFTLIFLVIFLASLR